MPRRLWSALLVAVVSGGLLALAFPPAGITRALAVLAPAGFALAVAHRRARSAALVTFIGMFVFLLFHVKWSGVFLGWLPWIALTTWQASYWLLLGPALVALQRLTWWPVWGAAAWVAIEAIQSRWPFGGFPWARLAFSQDAGAFTPYVAYGGVPLLSFVTALTGFVLADAWLRWNAEPTSRSVLVKRSANPEELSTDGEGEPRDARPLPGWLVRVGIAALVPLVGVLGWVTIPNGAGEGSPTVTVAVVQGNVPRAGLDFNAQRRAVLDNHVAGTLELAEAVARGEQPQPDFVLWPENSSDIDPYLNVDAATEIQAAADAINAPILVGAVVDGPGQNVRNMAILWLPQTGPDQTYVKRHPAPFAEYIPMRDFIRNFTDLVDLVRSEFIAGDEVGTIDVPGVEPLRIGDVICFEVAYDGLVNDVVRDGAQIITVQTNNATFGFTNEAPQQLAMGRIRAIEHGRTVLQASTTGISAIILPDGSIVADTGMFEPATLVESVPLRTGATFATMLGSWPEAVLCLGALVAVVIGTSGRLRTRRLAAAVHDGPHASDVAESR